MEKTPGFFDKISDDYAVWVNPFYLSERQQWFTDYLDSLNIRGKLVLDVGSGLGQFSRVARKLGGRTVSPGFSLESASEGQTSNTQLTPESPPSLGSSQGLQIRCNPSS